MAFRDQFDGFEDIDLDTTTNADRPANQHAKATPEPTPEPKPDLGLGASSPKFSDDELEAGEAHAKLRAEITDFIKYAIEQGATEANPLCAGAAATAGLGKTSISLKLIADLLQGRTVWLFEPTLEMAAKALADAKQLGINAVMIRGREANREDPARWPPQCWKADVAAIVARAGYSVWRTLCERYDKKTGRTCYCEHFGMCPYTLQFNDLDGKLIILVHDYLSLPLPIRPNMDFAFIDEKFHRVCLKELSCRWLE